MKLDAGAPDPAIAMPLGSGDPMAGFSNNQWYCHQARQTVFYAVFSSAAPDREGLLEMAEALMRSAPQLTTGFFGASEGEVPGRAVLDQIVSVIEVDDLDAYPQAWDMQGESLFSRPDLPLFRMVAAVRRGGPDDKGRAAALLVLSTHALMEGADSALLSRSQNAAHDLENVRPEPVPVTRKLMFRSIAWVLAPAQVALALVIAPRKVTTGYRTLNLSRARLRTAAQALGVRQRSLMFALASFALNQDGKGFSRRRISVIYADLDPANIRRTEEDFFRYRMIEVGFPVKGDFVAFVHGVDRALSRAEGKDATRTQHLLNSLFSVHRRLKSRFPALYPTRLFRFAGTYHLDLSVVPPLHLKGPLTKDFLEPVHVGTFHPGLNICVFAPGRRQVTFNFTVKERHLAEVDRVIALLDAVAPA